MNSGVLATVRFYPGGCVGCRVQRADLPVGSPQMRKPAGLIYAARTHYGDPMGRVLRRSRSEGETVEDHGDDDDVIQQRKHRRCDEYLEERLISLSDDDA